jgi:hypothetical protein
MKMSNIRKKLVSLAVASAVTGGAMMMAAPAHAMNVSQDNVGQVLLFPYYTVKNGFDTVFTVTNVSNYTAVFKVRFREALNSREVRDFNVILSPNDHWGAAVTTTTDGALVRTYDKTCTSPRLPGMVLNADRATAGVKGEVAFTNALYTGIYADGASQAMDRVQEGYFEVILMGVSDRDPNVSTNTLEYNAKHVSGVPRDCAAVDALFLDTVTNLGYMAPPENILKGHVMYINVANGKSIDAEPTAIENFQTVFNIMAPPSDVVPDLRDGDDPADITFMANGVVVTVPGVTGSQNAVTGLLSATSVINEFATGAGAATSWVVTFPTKHHYTDAYTSSGTSSGTASAPFSDWFYSDGKSCDNISMSLYNREEGTVVSVDDTQFSPYNPSNPTVALCYEANVIDFNSSSVFGAGTNRLAVDTSGVGTSGWAQVNFTETPAAVTGLNSILGLPTIGFAAVMRDAESATVNYGSSAEHTYLRAPVGGPGHYGNRNQNGNLGNP